MDTPSAFAEVHRGIFLCWRLLSRVWNSKIFLLFHVQIGCAKKSERSTEDTMHALMLAMSVAPRIDISKPPAPESCQPTSKSMLLLCRRKQDTREISLWPLDPSSNNTHTIMLYVICSKVVQSNFYLLFLLDTCCQGQMFCHVQIVTVFPSEVKFCFIFIIYSPASSRAKCRMCQGLS